MKQTDYIDRLITSEISRNNLAGANILLLKNEKELYCQSYGMADIERGIPMTRDSLFRIFSMTKPVTCAAVMLLMERGMLDLYDPVSRYLPGFRNQTVLNPDGSTSPVMREMQIRDLLNMTSGLSYPDDCTPVGKMVAALFDEMTDAQDAGHGFSTVTLANRLGQLPLCYHPGSRWQYSTSADVLGAVVDVVSGQRFSHFLQEEFFLPLEMPDTDFYVPDDKKHRFTQLYRCTPQSMFAASQLTDVVNALSSSNMTAPEQMNIRPELGKNLGMEGYAHRPVFESGGAGLVSTIDDYAHFATMLLQKGTYHGKRILSPKTAAFMCSPQLDDSFAKDLNWDSLRGYRYGNLMRYLVNRSDATNADLGEFGWDGWCGTYFTVDPSEDFIMLYFVQRCDTGCNEVTRRLKTMSYALL